VGEWARSGWIPSTKFKGHYRFNTAEIEPIMAERARLGQFPACFDKDGKGGWKQAVKDHWVGWTVTRDCKVMKAETVAHNGNTVPA
jgi:hypothetical protein